MDLGLENRVVAVAAASQGLGFATARLLSQEGAQVAICSRNEARIAAAADAIETETGNPVLAVAADITSNTDVNMFIQRTADQFGGIDILVTNCGGPPAATFEDIPMEGWQAAIDLVLLSAVRLVTAALPHLRLSDVPSVLAITSIAVKQPVSNLVLSNSIRMGVIGLIKTLSVELGVEGIRFNSILPGYTLTERLDELMKASAAIKGITLEEEIANRISDVPLGYLGKVDDFAKSAVFLCSPAAAYLNGVMLGHDGGSYRGIY